MPPNRRAFLIWLGRGAAVGAAVLGGAFGWGFFSRGHGRGTRTRRFLGRHAEVLARLQATRDGFVLDPERKVLLLLDPAAPTGLVAVSLVCTHLGCTLRPSVGNRTLDCPCHGSAFAFLSSADAVAPLGRVLVGPATRDLDRLAVVAVGERLFLEDAPDA